MELFIWILIFIFSLAVIVKSADIFSDSAEKIGLAIGIPAFIVGVTIVSIGTSLPELIISILSIIEKSPEIVLGNAIGSNITNIFLILGIAGIIGKKLEVTYDLIHVDLPLLVGSAFLVSLMALDGEITRFEGLILTFGSVIYLLYTINTKKRRDLKEKQQDKKIAEEIKDEHDITKPKPKLKKRSFLLLIITSIFMFVAAEYMVQSINAIAEIIDVGKEIIALSVVAFGTSMPELSVTIALARKKHSEMVLGNILGSSIFNSFAVIGIPALFSGLVVTQTIITLGLPMLIIATLLYFFTTQEKQLTQWEGWLLIMFYLFYIGELVITS